MLTGELLVFFCQFTVRTEFIYVRVVWPSLVSISYVSVQQKSGEKFFLKSFLIVPSEIWKREIFGIKNLYKGRLSLKKSLQASKRSFLIWPACIRIWIWIWIRIHWPQWIRRIKSGSESLQKMMLYLFAAFREPTICDFVLRHMCWVTWHPSPYPASQCDAGNTSV
jgi:hypothetical protein